MKIAVVGAGVVGLSCGYELAELGHDVTMIDGASAGAGGSTGNAGWITPFLSSPRAAPGALRDAATSFADREGPARMLPHAEFAFAAWGLRFLWASGAKRSAGRAQFLQTFGQSALGYYDSLAERGVEFEEHRDGLAVVFKEESNLAHYEASVPKMREMGYRGAIDVHRGSAVEDFDLAVDPSVAGVLHLREERHVRPESVCVGLAEAARASGAELIENDPVTQIAEQSGARRWLVVTRSGRTLTVDTVVLAAGFHTRDLLKPLGIRVPLEAAKGTSITARGTGTPPTHPLKMFENMVACSPFGDTVRLSGTFDIGRRDFEINQHRLQMVVRQGLKYLRDWRPKDVDLEWVGHRSVSADDTPIIGSVAGRDGLYLATGHGTLGVTLGPATGALAAREITTGVNEAHLTPFRLSRF